MWGRLCLLKQNKKYICWPDCLTITDKEDLLFLRSTFITGHAHYVQLIYEIVSISGDFSLHEILNRYLFGINLIYLCKYSKTCLKQPLKSRAKIGFQELLSLNAGQNYCRMLSFYLH